MKLQRQLGITVSTLTGVEPLQYGFMSEPMPLPFLAIILRLNGNIYKTLLHLSVHNNETNPKYSSIILEY
jgi:hypothetical protein